MKKAIVALLVAAMTFGLVACAQTGAAPAAAEPAAAESAGESTEAAETSAAPAASTNGNIPTIRFAYNWSGTDTSQHIEFEKRVKDYQEAHKDEVNLVLEVSLDLSLQDKIKVDLAADDLPDLFLYWGGMSNVGTMIENDKIVDVDTYCSVSTELEKDMWPESTFMDSTVGDKSYMFPIESFKWFTIYNKGLYDEFGLEIPKTYDDFKKCAEVFNENGIVPICVGSAGGEYGHVFYNQVLYQLEGGVADTRDLNVDCEFESAATQKAAEYIDEMRDLNMFPSDTIAAGGASYTLLYTQRKASMMICAPWLLDELDPNVLEETVIAPFFSLPDATVMPETFNMGSVSEGLCISKASFDDPAKQEQVVKFADYILSDDTFNAMAATNTMPAKEIEVDPSVLNPWMAKAIDATNGQETYQPLWFLLPNTETSTTYLDSLDELFAGSIHADEFIEKVQAAFDEAKAEMN